MTGRTAGSVIIPAHQEAAVIARCLTALCCGVQRGALDVVVSCNGCTDGTADVARSLPYEVTVLEQETASKPAALRLAESRCDTMPRLYVDADVVLPGASALAVLERLREGALAARPPVQYDTTGASFLVQRFQRARAGVPSLHTSLWGAGVYGLSEAGRQRFGTFPDVVGDDLFVDRLFSADEVEIVPCEPVTVRAPRRTADLVRLLRRSYRGQAEADVTGASDRSSTGTTLGTVLRNGVRSPAAALDSAVYVGLAVSARSLVRARPAVRWERDESSRAPVQASDGTSGAPS